MSFLLLAAALPALYWDKGPETADPLKKAGIVQVAVPAPLEAAWKGQPGVAVRVFDVSSAEKLLTPGVQFRMNVASASRSPWVDTNGWRYQRKPDGRYYYSAPGPAAALAAAEAYMYGAEAAIQTDAAGIEPLARMLSFLAQLPPANMAAVADIGFLDDGSAEAGEAMNLMTRKNLLFRVTQKPDGRLKLNVPFGSAKYPKAEAANPVEFAQKIRFELTDEKRSFRIYGSEVVLARLEGDGRKLRIHLLNYSGAQRAVPGVRIRVSGRYRKQEIRAAGLADAKLQEAEVLKDATEFTVPEMRTYAVVDLMN